MIESKEQYEAFIKLNDMGKGARQGHYGWEAHLTIEALREVARAAETYRDSHTMEGANKEGELLMDFTERIVAERARIDEALDALPDWILEE